MVSGVCWGARPFGLEAGPCSEKQDAEKAIKPQPTDPAKTEIKRTMEATLIMNPLRMKSAHRRLGDCIAGHEAAWNHSSTRSAGQQNQARSRPTAIPNTRPIPEAPSAEPILSCTPSSSPPPPQSQPAPALPLFPHRAEGRASGPQLPGARRLQNPAEGRIPATARRQPSFSSAVSSRRPTMPARAWITQRRGPHAGTCPQAGDLVYFQIRI